MKFQGNTDIPTSCHVVSDGHVDVSHNTSQGVAIVMKVAPVNYFLSVESQQWILVQRILQ